MVIVGGKKRVWFWDGLGYFFGFGFSEDVRLGA